MSMGLSPSTCHPEMPVLGLGWCARCYHREYARTRRKDRIEARRRWVARTRPPRPPKPHPEPTPVVSLAELAARIMAAKARRAVNDGQGGW